MKPALLLALAFTGLALATACDNAGGGDVTPSTTVSPQPPGRTPTAIAGPGVCQTNPDPATPDILEVDSPSVDDSVTPPVTVSGRIATSEGRFRISIFIASGARISDLQTTSDVAQVLSPFSEALPFSVTEDTAACIWVFEVSPVDEVTQMNVVQIPVTLLPGSAQAICQPNPDPATPEFQVIDQPNQADVITSPVTISGQILAFEATYQIGIFDAAGDPIAETFGMADAMEIGELAPFSIDVTFDVDEPKAACIWVYEQSAMDGSPVHVGQISVILLP